MSKILLIIANKGFQTKEYHDPKRILEAAGHRVVTGAMKAGRAISNMGEDVNVDVELPSVLVEDYDGIFIIGGPGALADLDNTEVIRVMKDASLNEDLLYGAICVSPRILAKAGLLSGKHATGWNGDDKLEEIFAAHDVIYESRSVVVDGRIITADGPTSAEGFGGVINDLLKNKI